VFKKSMSYNTRFKHRFQAVSDAPADLPNCPHKTTKGQKFCPECGVPVGSIGLEDAIEKWIADQRETTDRYFMSGWDADDVCCWYSWIDDMGALSLAFPQVLFEITGVGEEAGDHWRAWFLGGKYYKVKAEFPSFDVSKLGQLITT
jgi:hypothetical protein